MERRVLLSAIEPIVVDFGNAPPDAPIAGLEQQLAPEGAEATGVARVMVLHVYFQDYAATARYTQTQLEGLWTQIDQLYSDTSYGNMTIDYQVSSLFQLPDDRSDYIDDGDGMGGTPCDPTSTGDLSCGGKFDKVLLDAINNAPAGLDWSNLDAIMVLMAETDPTQFHRGQGTSARTLPQGPGGANKTVGAAIFSENPGDTDGQVWGRMAHEVGHAFQGGGPAHPSNYNSEFELMDSNYPGQIGVFEKQDGMGYPGWLPGYKYQEFTSAGGGGVANLWPMEYDPDGQPNAQAVRVKITDDLYYLVSVRRRILGDDLNAGFSPPGIPDEGVLIERVVVGGDPWVTLQAPPGGDRNDLWHVGQTYSRLADGISIEVTRKSVPPDHYEIYVRYNPDVAFFPDMSMDPWTSPPGNTWETTDIWFDSPVNGYDSYRYGTWNDLSGNPVARGNGDPPAIALPNRVYARVRNVGTSTASNVKVNFEITDPMGVGIAGASGWAALGSTDSTEFPGLAAIAPGDYEDVYIEWTPDIAVSPEDVVDGLFYFHTCVRVKIDPVAGETVLANQDGDREQENITDFEAVPPEEGGAGRPFHQIIRLRNDDLKDSQYFYINYEHNLPAGWKLKINSGAMGMKLGPNEVVDIPVDIEPVGPAVLGSAFYVDVSASRQIVMTNDLKPEDTHHHIEPLGGVRVAARVLRDTDIDGKAERRGPNEIWVGGKLDVLEFERFYDPKNPLRVMIVGRNSAGENMPATLRTLVVREDASFEGYLGVDLTQGEPESVVILFGGTTELASSAAGPIMILRTDFGDAPDPTYPTKLENNGARHTIRTGFYLGTRVDAEANGQPNGDATGDDINPAIADDEDGLVGLSALIPGAVAQAQIRASAKGFLNAWIDYNADGDWADAGEQISMALGLVAGLNTVSFLVPATAKEDAQTFARLRFSSVSVLPYYGPAADGEVEDYRVLIQKFRGDFGDAPQSTGAVGYPTLLASDGARHVSRPGFYMGTWIDEESDGQPTGDALGDDLNPAADDEDGVIFRSIIAAGSTARVDVTVSISGFLDAFFDFNIDGDWADPGEQVFVSRPVAGGLNHLSFFVPATAKAGISFARFRFSSTGGLSYAGLASDGEVEDYRITIRSAVKADHFEPNPGPQEAVRLGFYGQTRTGLSLDREGDEDWFAWTSEDADLVTMNLSSNQAEGDLVLEVYDATGELIGSSNEPGNVERLSFKSNQGQTYYFKVSDSMAAIQAEYALDWLLAGSSENYAVLFSGGGDASNNHDRYYNNTKELYELLRDEYGLSADNIHVLFADGTNPAVDRSSGVNSDMSFATNVYSATSANLQSVLDTLTPLVDSNDHLLFWGFDHGGGTYNAPGTTGEETLVGWYSSVDDASLADWLADVGAGYLTAAHTQCFAGGMIDDMTVSTRVFACAATNHYEYSWGDGFASAFNDALDTHQATAYDTYYYAYEHDPYATDGEGPGGTVGNSREHPWASGEGDFRIFARRWTWLPHLDRVLQLAYTVPIPDFTISYDQLRAAAMESDEQVMDLSFRVESVEAGVLTKDGRPVIPGQTLLSFGESLVWHQLLGAPEAQGDVNAFTIRAFNGMAVSDERAVVSIRFEAGGVTAVDDSAQTTEDSSVPIAVLKNDISQSGLLSIGGVGLPAHGRAVISGNAIVYTPDPDFSGTDQFTYYAVSTLGESDPATVSIAVTAANDPPEAYGDSAVVAYGSVSNIIDVLANDFDPESKPFSRNEPPYLLSILVKTPPLHGSLSHSGDGRLLYTPAAGYSGTDSFTYQASDGVNFSNIATVAIRVLPAQQPTADLGDAPDSTNTPGAEMTAYSWGVLAHFPTVYRAGSPFYGPIHENPAPAHFGRGVSLENEADTGPDADGVNNLDPKADLENRDGADDGLVGLMTLTHWELNRFSYQVTIDESMVGKPLYVNSWMDWNRDGDWDDTMAFPDDHTAMEWCVRNQQLVFKDAGTHTITTPAFYAWHPTGAGQTVPLWMRLTLADSTWQSQPGQGYGGSGPSAGYRYGETEDYYIPTYAQMARDFGDAPDDPDITNFHTIMLYNGARHALAQGVMLGQAIDAETDGQPGYSAMGDDLSPAGVVDDEDGVKFLTPLMRGQLASVEVTASVPGYLNAWFDFNFDGFWTGPADRVFDNHPLDAGPNILTFLVPEDAIVAETFARFRFTREASLIGYDGLAPDGEVEDYRVKIAEPLGTITGIKYEDLNGSGAQDPGEPGLAEWTIMLQVDDDGTWDLFTTTGPDGRYAFTGLSAGSYIVGEAQDPAWQQTQPVAPGLYTIVLPPGGSVGDIDFGNYRLPQYPRNDLGDAPDSSNSFDVPMTAYPGVAAHYPTVYAAGSPFYGPLHNDPKGVAHLGRGVSLENEADIGPDEDVASALLGAMIDQWASHVIAFSSEYSTGGWSAQQVLHAPNTFAYGDLPTAWAAADVDGGLGFLAMGYARPVYATGVTVRETLSNGFVRRIDVLDTSDVYHTVWQGIDTSPTGAPADFRVDFPMTPYAVKGVRIIVDQDHEMGGWEEVDALSLHGAEAIMVNNIDPPNDSASHDGADDGLVGTLRLVSGEWNAFDYLVRVRNPSGQTLYVNAWFDWNRDGDWDDVVKLPDGTAAPERAVADQPLNFIAAGLYQVTSPLFLASHPEPSPGVVMPIWMRLTLAERPWEPDTGGVGVGVGGSGPAGGYAIGETEDYYIRSYEQAGLDFGDAPDPRYPTLLEDGARHVIVGPWLGPADQLPDSEPDGQPSANALGDDHSGRDDENGLYTWTYDVVFNGSFEAGFHGEGLSNPLDGVADWVPSGWDRHETFTGGVIEDAAIGMGEGPAGAGDSALWFKRSGDNASGDDTMVQQPLVLSASVPGFKSLVLSLDLKIVQQELEAGGWVDPAFEWPVMVEIQYEDSLGNARVWRHGWYIDPPGDGVRALDPGIDPYIEFADSQVDADIWTHATFNLLNELQDAAIVTGIRVGGSGWSYEGLVDNVSVVGVRRHILLPAGTDSSVQVTVSGGGGYLDGWIDFNADGDWDDDGEQIVSGWFADGVHTIPVSVPATIMTTMARFRINRERDIGPRGLAYSGEVEDWETIFYGSGGGWDFGDAPEPYPTVLDGTTNGARHWVSSTGPRIGLVAPDVDPNGQPDPFARGDDNNGIDDEDGVTLAAIITQGVAGSITIQVSGGGGYLDGWLDLDGNNVWDEYERIVGGWHDDGVYNLPVTIPVGGAAGLTYARFRINSLDPLDEPLGPAHNGEVEDWAIYVKPGPVKWEQPPVPAHPDNLYYGWNEPSEYNGSQLAADDWVCTTAQPVTKIVWWGSFLGFNGTGLEDLGLYTDFHISIWTDVKAGEGQPWSHPGKVIWEAWPNDFTQYSWQYVGRDFDPRTQTYESTFRFEVELSERNWFYQEPGRSDVYWLCISALYADGVQPQYPFGWKTLPKDSDSPDAAVRIFRPTTDNAGMVFESGEPITWPVQLRPWDLAFELVSEPQGLKWLQSPDPQLPGIHDHDWVSGGAAHQVTLADQWVCQGGVVTDLHWWGNYEVDDTGAEMRGSGIRKFRLSIHEDAGGLPGVLLWNTTVPFDDVYETYVGFENGEGSPVYRYVYLPPQGFNQEPGKVYWLDISAISNDANDPALWRWQEASRSTTPTIYPAAAQVDNGPWSYIVWAGAPIATDLAFAITSIDTKWSQPPRPYEPPDAWYGWDEPSLFINGPIIADDWVCTTDQPVTDVHWWGSFVGWDQPDAPTQLPVAYQLGIWTDVPADPAGTNTFSHPGTMIWQAFAQEVKMEFAGWDFDPRYPDAPPEATFYFSVDLPQEQWFYQQGESNIFWLSIAAIYLNGETAWPFGWKTRPRDLKSPAPDDAVRIFMPQMPQPGMVYEQGMPIYWPDPDRSWDMAFLLTTKTEPATATITGRKVLDAHFNGVEASDPGLAGWTIFADNGNGAIDPGEVWTTTGSDGSYTLTVPAGMTYYITEMPLAGWIPTQPSGGVLAVTPLPGETIAVDFGNFPIVFWGGDGVDDDYYVRLDVTGTVVEIFESYPPGPNPDYSAPLAMLPSLTFNTLGGGHFWRDRLLVSLANGSPVPAGGLHFDGGAGEDFLILLDPASTDSLGYSAGHVVISGGPSIVTTDVEQRIIGPNSGTVLALTALAVADVTVRAGLGTQTLFTDGLSLAGAGRIELDSGADLIVQATAATRQTVLGDVFDWIASARNALPLWSGPGIGSIGPLLVPNTGLACILNDNGSGSPLYGDFNGVPVDENCILVKHTYNGDADANGLIDGSDYHKADRGYLAVLPGYLYGDCDYSGVRDGDDYFLMDTAFLSQTVIMAASSVTVKTPAEAAALPAASPAAAEPSEPIMTLPASAGFTSAAPWSRSARAIDQSLLERAENRESVRSLLASDDVVLGKWRDNRIV